jgi:hypothetical protein
MSEIDLSRQVIEPAARPRARAPEDVAAMAVAVQANLVTLKVADAKLQGIEPQKHAIRVAPPGAVTRFRETLIEREQLKQYGATELRLRLHEVWGQFCLAAWMFHVDDPYEPPDFSRCAATHTLRCGAVLRYKELEIEGSLWRMHYEQRRRHDPAYASLPEFKPDTLVAQRIPVVVFGRSVERAGDDELLLCSCEYAGMLATIRWAADERRRWGEPGIMDVNGRPEVAS